MQAVPPDHDSGRPLKAMHLSPCRQVKALVEVETVSELEYLGSLANFLKSQGHLGCEQIFVVCYSPKYQKGWLSGGFSEVEVI